MATKTLVADRSAVFARSSGGLNLGGGQDLHLPIINNPAGYSIRAGVGFTPPAGFFDDMRRITSVQLRVAGTNGTAHVAKGAAAKAYVYRIIAQWVANSAGESWSTAPTVYGGPAVTGTDGIVMTMPTGYSNGFGDVTAMAMAWAPNTTLGPTGLPGGGGVCYGLALQESGGAVDAAEVYSAVWSTATERPALVFTYDTNARPYAPTLVYPAGADQPANKFKFQTGDPDGDAIVNYDLQVSTDPTFAVVSHWDVVNSSTSLAGYVVDRNYAGTAMTNGVRYYWRARMADAGGDSDWSTVATFVKAPGVSADDLYDYWMAAILEDMRAGRTVLQLGTLRPVGAEVAKLVCAEYGDLFRVKWVETTPPVDEDVYLLGQKVALSPDGWSVDAIVERKRDVG